MKKLFLSILPLLLLLPGCSRQQPSRHFVILVDISASIEKDSIEQCIAAIAKLIEKTNRGDSVSIIPIMGDAEAQSTGRVLRFKKPVNRSPYDADLIGFSKQVQQSLQEFRVQALKHPTNKTDIFGAIRMAGEEFTSASNRERVMIVFSDFVEDDDGVNFLSDRRLANTKTAVLYASLEAKVAFASGKPCAKVYLGLLRSKDLHALHRQRREAIRQFWHEFFRSSGAEPVYTTDGLLAAGFDPP